MGARRWFSRRGQRALGGALTTLACARLLVLLSPGALHLSLETDPRPSVPFSVHLSAHAIGEVELVLTALPATPEAILDQPPHAPPPWHPPPLLSRTQALREDLAHTYRQVHAALSPRGRELLRDLFGLTEPLGRALGEPHETSQVSAGLVAAWRVDAAERGWNEFDLDVGPLTAGLYRLTARRGDEWTELKILVTDLSMLAVRDSAALAILATHAGGGEPVAEVEVWAAVHGHLQSLGKTSAQGLLVLRPGLGNVDWTSETGAQLCGQRNDSFARIELLPPPIHFFPELGTAALFLDRPRYLSGDTVHLWALPRELRGSSGFERSLSIPDSNHVVLSLIDREGHTLWQRVSEMDPLGVVSAEVELPPGLFAGEYTLALSWGEERRGVAFGVESGVPAELSARVIAVNREGFHVEVVDRIRRPLPGALVRWTTLRLPPSDEESMDNGPVEVLASGNGITAQGGVFEVRFPHALPSRARVEVQAEVEDAAGHTALANADLPAGSISATSLRLRPDRLLVRPGKQATLSVDTRGPDGSPQRARLEILIQPIVAAPSGEPQKREAIRRGMETDAHGHAVLTLPAFQPGYVEVDVASEGGPVVAQALVFVTESGGDIPITPDRLLLIAEPAEHHHVDEQRVLVMTPFDTGTVLLAVEPSPPAAAPALAAVHGYSGVAHLHLPTTSSAVFVSAGATQGGRLFQERLQLAPSNRPTGMLVRGSFERPPRSGQRALLTLQTDDALGRPLPSKVLGRLSVSGEESVPLFDQLRPAFAPSAAFSVSRSWRGSATRSPEVRQRDLVPYGPSQPPDASPAHPDAVSFVTDTPENGRAQQAIVLPAWLSRNGMATEVGPAAATLVLRAIAGPDQLGESRQSMALQPSAHLVLLAPPWARPGDRPVVTLQMRTAEGALSPGVCPVELLGTGGAIPTSCDSPSQRSTATLQIGEASRAIDLSASLAAEGAPRLAVQRQVTVWGEDGAPATSRELALQLARGLAVPPAGGEEADLACAAVRAVGAVLPGDQRLAAQAVMQLAQLERVEGGFGPDEGELRRDLAALEGLTDLRLVVDAALIDRTSARVKALSAHLDEDQRRELWLPQERRSAAAYGSIDLANASPRELAHRPLGRKLGASDLQVLVRRLAQRLSSADVLDTAEIAVALHRLPGEVPLDRIETGPTARDAQRTYERLSRTGWTEAILAAGDEPPDAIRMPLGQAALPLGTELWVTLEGRVSPGGMHCLRDPIPAGLAPIGLPTSVVHEGWLLFCAEPRDGKISFGYGARALYAGHFMAPPPALGFVGAGGSSATEVLEVSP